MSIIQPTKPSFFMRGILIGMLVFAASAQAQIPTFSFFPANLGTWVFNNATGSASFCIPLKNAYGNPQGRCKVLGNVGASVNGFIVNLTGSLNMDLFIVSKTSGAIFNCTVMLLNGTDPIGGCAQISSTNILQ